MVRTAMARQKDRRTTHLGRPRLRWYGRAFAATALLTAGLVDIGPARALPGTPAPFDPNVPQAFLIQGDSQTTPGTFVLQRAQVQPDGSAVYVNEGTVGIQANAIGFNPADGFVYATTYQNATPSNTVIRIGQNGVWETVKTPANANCTLPAVGTNDYLAGTFVGGFYYAYLPTASSTTSFTVQKLDVTTCTRTTYTVTGLANPPDTVALPFDLSFADGFFWGVNGNGFLVRIPLSAGAVQFTNLAGILPTGNPYGASWTMGNGNPVFQNNATGDFFQLDTTPLLSASPPVLVSRVNAPTNTQNDGTFVPGQPTDLALSKTGVDLYQAPQQVTYTYVVHNNGPGTSSGAIVTDQLPAQMSYVSSSTACFNRASTPTLPACVAGNTNLGFSVPAIAAGADFAFTVTVALAAGATGTKTNTATVLPNDADTDPANNTDSTTMVPGTATITLDKQVASITDTNANNLDDAGDVIHYTFLVTNTSPVTVVSVAVADPLVGTVSCPSTSLAPGASTLCTGSYTITQADVNAGSRSNTATASATTAGGIPTNQPSDSTTTPLDQVAGIDLVKTPNRSTLVAGQTVTYTFTATNTGTVTLTIVQIAEGAFNGLGAPMSALGGCTPALGSSLAAGASMSCTATYVVTQADVDRFAANGTTLDNAASATGTPPTGPPATDTANATISATPAPAIDLTKAAGTVSDNDANGTDAGDTLGFTFSVKNTGNVTLNPVVVADPLLTGQGITISCPPGPLAPGATTACTASAPYTLTQADIDSGAVSNTATASGTTPSGSTVTDPSSTSTPLAPPSEITLTKTPDRTTLVTGQTVTYTFTATNTGATTLSNVQIAEGTFNGLGGPMSALTGCTPALGSSLAPNQTMTCTATYVVAQADVDRFANTGTALTNDAGVSATPPTGPDVSDTANAAVPSTPTPSLSLTKLAGPLTDANASGSTDAGDTITYSFVVQNTGNVSLKGIAVADPMLAGQGITITCTPTALAPGQTAACTTSAPYVMTAADVAADEVTNTATASGTDPGNATVPSNPSSTTTLLPNLDLTKTPSTSTMVVGQTVTYTFVATNTGGTTLTDVQIAESAFNGLGAPMSALTGCTPALGATLAPGETMTCTASYVVTQADVDRFAADGTTLDNGASATGTPPTGPPVSDSATASLTATPAPAITLTKSAGAVADLDANGTDAGDTISFTFSVQNTGNVTLDPVTVADPLLAGQGITITCPAGPLAPTATRTCTASAPYTLTQADIDSGDVSNTATASGTTPSGGTVTDPDSTNTPLTPPSQITLTKTADRTTLVAGQTVTYTFTATNTGATTLTDVQIAEGAFNGLGAPMSALTGCTPALGSSLAPGATMTCTATYVVVQADVDRFAGSGTPVQNAASVTATPPTGPDVTDTAQAQVPAAPAPAIGLTKGASSVSDLDANGTDAGDTISFTFSVQNTGNVALDPVAVSDPLLGGQGITVTCPAGSLAPGATTSCTASAPYALTQADVDAGVVANTATATGTPPAGPPVTDTSSTTTPLVTTSEITLAKTPSTSTMVAGQTVTYTLVAANTGATTLTGVQIAEGAFNGLGGPMSALTGCTPALGSTLAPNQTMTCTAAYVVTQADVDRFAADGTTLDNAASATGTPPTGPDVTGTATASLTATPAPSIDLTKTAGSVTDVDGNGTDAGDTLLFAFQVHNTGNVTLDPVTVADPLLAGQGITVTCPAAPLAPDAAVSCTASDPYTLTQAEIDSGTVSNTATASGTTPSGGAVTDTSSTSTPLTPGSAITLAKTPSTSTMVAGQTVTYTLVATNTGGTTLTAVQIAEGAFNGLGGPMSALTGCAPALGSPLAPGETMACTASYVVTQADVDRFAADGTTLDNAASATGTPPTGPDVTDTANASLTATPAPSIELTKGASAVADQDANGTDAGDTISFTFSVQNTGNVTLDPVTVADPLLGSQGITISCPPGPLAPTATTTCTASAPYTLTQAEVNAGVLTNTATATGTTPSGGTVTDTSSTSTSLASAPQITLTKTAGTVTDADGNGTDAGDTLGFSFSVQNTGNVTLDPVTVADPLLAGQGITISCAPGPLAPTATRTCTASAPYTLTQADIDSGTVSNTATASGTTPSGGTVTDPSSTNTPLTPPSQITLTKTADRTTLVAGQTVTYTLSATNTGATTLTDVQVAEDSFNGAGTMSVPSCTPTLGSTLAPDRTITCTATYVVTQADVDALVQQGTQLSNAATATGTPPTGPDVTSTDEVAIPATNGPALTLDKKVARVDDVNRNGLTDAGDEIHWEFVVTNTGGVSVTQVAIDDPMVALVICEATTLAPGAQTICRPHATYVVTQADVDAGGVRNTATASGVDPGGDPVVTDPDSTFTPTDQVVALRLEKRVAVVIDMNGTGTVDAGDQITYEFDVSNTGTVTLSGIAVDDPKLADAGITVSCPPDPVPAGATILCTADMAYVVTAADEASGGVHNVATASGVPPGGERHVSPPSHADLPTGTGGQGNQGGDLGDTGLPAGLPPLVLLGLVTLGSGVALARRTR
ncbi:MAG: DUF11 domain-containing protein [Nocardioidaceae bacterium]|nr:DUF11 domain-containing protein [Nocardioidaceae bacterium]